MPFRKNWFDEIADVTSQREYQRANIRIVDPSLIESEYNFETKEFEYTGDGLVYEGQARVIGVRWGVFSGGESQANSKTLSGIRIQVPQRSAGRIKTGCQVFVDSAPNPVLQNYVFTIRTDIQGSSDASRTFECELDSDVELVENGG